ncbi:CSS-motif domain-containing protein [Thermomonas brevis]
MAGFIRTRRLPFLPASALLAVALPTALALLMAHWASMQRLQEIAAMTARQTLSRVDTINIEMTKANGMLALVDGQAPCSPESLRLMRKAMLHTDMLADVGYIRDDRILCSAFGQQGQAVGAPAYVSGPGFAIRNAVRLPDAPDIALVATTVPDTGISMFVHGTQALEGIPVDEPWRVAVVGYGRGPAQGVVLAERGGFEPGLATARGRGRCRHLHPRPPHRRLGAFEDRRLHGVRGDAGGDVATVGAQGHVAGAGAGRPGQPAARLRAAACRSAQHHHPQPVATGDQARRAVAGLPAHRGPGHRPLGRRGGADALDASAR